MLIMYHMIVSCQMCSVPLKSCTMVDPLKHHHCFISPANSKLVSINIHVCFLTLIGMDDWVYPLAWKTFKLNSVYKSCHLVRHILKDKLSVKGKNGRKYKAIKQMVSRKYVERERETYMLLVLIRFSILECKKYLPLSPVYQHNTDCSWEFVSLHHVIII